MSIDSSNRIGNHDCVGQSGVTITVVAWSWISFERNCEMRLKGGESETPDEPPVQCERVCHPRAGLGKPTDKNRELCVP